MERLSRSCAVQNVAVLNGAAWNGAVSNADDLGEREPAGGAALRRPDRRFGY
jgi:hypothetical protein